MANSDWHAIERGAELRCKTERLIMQDRYATGRPAGHLGDFEKQWNGAKKLMVEGLRRLNNLLDTML